MKRSCRSLILVFAFLLSPAVARASFADDLVVGYDGLYISGAVIGGQDADLGLLRQTLWAELGVGDFGVGMTAVGAHDVKNGALDPEYGLMLTGRWGPVLADFLRLDSFLRVGLTHEWSDPASALFATDTDLRLGLVAFDPVGVGTMGSAVFFSGHAGGRINWRGKAQLLGGAGAWWRQLGIYATLFWTLNGPSQPSPTEEAFWARVDDAGLTVSLSWDLELPSEQSLRIAARYNHPIRNAGRDLGLTLTWRFAFLEAGEVEEAAW